MLVLQTTYVLRIPYSCGVVLVFLVLAGNSFWCYDNTVSCAGVSIFLLWQESQFSKYFLVESENFLLVHRNRYLEGMDDGQKTPRGHPDFHPYVKIQRVSYYRHLSG